MLDFDIIALRKLTGGLDVKEQNKIKIFEEKQVRTKWDDENEKWWFSVVDIVPVLTDAEYQQARKYWSVLKTRMKKEGNESTTICSQLKMQARL